MTEVDLKYQRLRYVLAEYGRVLVAFSGGVDSSFLLRVASEVLPGTVVALTVLWVWLRLLPWSTS
jgi:uncharacterized protein